MNHGVYHERGGPSTGVQQERLSLRFGRFRLGGSMLLMVFLMMNFQMLTITGGTSDGISVKIYHVLGMTALPIALSRRRLRLPPLLVTLFFITVVVVSLLGYSAFGWNAVLVNYLFAGYIFVISANLSLGLGRASVLRILRMATLFVFSAVFIKTIVVWDKIAAFLSSPWGHPNIPLFYGGGTNLEATWLAMSSVFFLRTRLYYPLAAFTLVLSALYASRVGTILAILVLLYPSIPSTIQRLRNLGIQAVIAGVIIAFALPFILDSYVVDRFLALGSDPGSVGRLTMWEHIGHAFLAHPSGYGAGNALAAIEATSGRAMSDSNLHNIYAQTLLDFGIIGFALLVVLVAGVFWREYKSGFTNPLGAYILLYCVAGLVQFRGGDSLLWFVAGLYSVTRLQEPRMEIPRVADS